MKEQNNLHICIIPDDIEVCGHGVAVSECWQDENNKLWVGNGGEYANTVRFCPFCGFTLNEKTK